MGPWLVRCSTIITSHVVLEAPGFGLHGFRCPEWVWLPDSEALEFPQLRGHCFMTPTLVHSEACKCIEHHVTVLSKFYLSPPVMFFPSQRHNRTVAV